MNKNRIKQYADELEQAFLKARSEYAEAANQLDAAESRRNKANFMTETYFGEKAAEIALADAVLKRAKAQFDAVSVDCWAVFKKEQKRLTEEFSNAVHADSLINPSNVDVATLELLKSGVCGVDDYKALLSRFDGNSTMTRLIAKYAADAAESATNTAERSEYGLMARTAADADNAVIQAWENICSISDRLSGQSHGKAERSYVQQMNAQWEQLAAPMIEAL